MSERQEFAALLGQTSRELRRLGGCARSKPIIGGSFGASGYVLGSQVLRSRGLDVVIYHVMTHDGFVLASSESKTLALHAARITLRAFSPAELSALILAHAAEVEEERRQVIAARRAMELPTRRETVKSIPKRRREIFEASGGACHYCSTPLQLDGKWHIEHKMPKALLGGNERANLVASCVPCNLKKRDKTDQEFIAARSA